MDRQLSGLANEQSWRLVDRRTAIPRELLAGRVYYHDPITIAMDRHCCLVVASNPVAPVNWRLAGWASMLLALPPTVFPSEGLAQAADDKKLMLSTPNLLVFPKLQAPWVLELRFARWHRRIDLSVWEYTGNDVDVFDRLNLLEGELL